ncbi:hypothetical protein D8674_000046 [Pyrus ussuriensis x Pyrus communis]|uniref:Aminotransferase-like plant mobile domain-containing protein n=1 Tax=Pyrus ussuriensis x Pyrus communis TaxID=2448454 RepID=A0A5N5F284_9ROSA|nr:hypothetical protein D8674_000046 [Pyrus ussuriensis x Pyrus communis]
MAESSISSSKWPNHHCDFPLMNDDAWVKWINELEPILKKKWMNNGIYELIMPSKITVVAKPELLTTVLLFWNSSTNTFDFRIGPMSPTILDMVQVFGLRPSAPPSCSTAESSAAAKAKRQEAGEGGDNSELFGDSEPEEEPEARTQVSRRVRATVVETSELEPEKQPVPKRATPIRKRIKAQTSKISKTTTVFPYSGREDLTARDFFSLTRSRQAPPSQAKSIPLVVTPTSQFDPLTGKMMHFLLLMPLKLLKCLLPNLRFPLRVLEKTTTTATFIPAPAPTLTIFSALLTEAAPTATIEGHKSFLRLFENLQALKDQHHKAERASNRVKCFQEKYLSSLRAEKVTLTNHLSQKVEELEKISQEVEDSKDQLVNNNMHLGELSRIFTIMQAYFSRIVAMAEDVKLLD